MLTAKGKVVLYILGELLALFILAIPLIALQFVEPFHRGIFPDDTSIALPKRPNTVSVVWAGVFGLATPLLAIFIVEIYHSIKNGIQLRDVETQIPLIIIRLYKFIGCMALSFLALMVVVNVIKETVGSLRPFFLEACIPNYNGNDYQPAVCTSNNTRLIEEARLSFPSGHSAASVWGAAMTSFYLQIRFPECPAKLLKALIQISVSALAFYICLTRIQDNWHRPVDVITGSLLGILAASMIFLIPAVQEERSKGSRHIFTPVVAPA